MHPTLNVKRFGDAKGFLSREHFWLCGTRNSLDLFAWGAEVEHRSFLKNLSVPPVQSTSLVFDTPEPGNEVY
jgi:hypothetical protein